MSFLFPSVPIEVSDSFLIIYLQTIELILSKNNNISIDEGIEKLKSLTFSEKYKKIIISITKKKLTKKNLVFYSINSNNNTSLQKFMQNSNNNMNNINSNYYFYKRKRNYLSLINSNKKNEIINKNLNINSNNRYSKEETTNNEIKIEKIKLL